MIEGATPPFEVDRHNAERPTMLCDAGVVAIPPRARGQKSPGTREFADGLAGNMTCVEFRGSGKVTVGISKQAAAFWALMRSGPEQVSLPIDARREAGEHAEDATAEPVGVTVADWHGGLHVRPDGVVHARILYLFGGGYMLGSPASRRKTAGHLAIAANAEVFVPTYRRAPEHPFPAAYDDAVAAFGRVPGDLPVFVAGDSSGGGLAVATAVAVGATGVVAFSPWADLTCSSPTMVSNADRDIECTQVSLTEMAGWYAAGASLTDPRLSPAFSEPSTLPPLLAFVGSDEILLDDARRLTATAKDATLTVGEGMQHVWPIWIGVFPEAGEAMDRAGAWIRDRSSVGVVRQT